MWTYLVSNRSVLIILFVVFYSCYAAILVTPYGFSDDYTYLASLGIKRELGIKEMMMGGYQSNYSTLLEPHGQRTISRIDSVPHNENRMRVQDFLCAILHKGP